MSLLSSPPVQSRRLPPYGKALMEARQRGLVPVDLFIRVDDWYETKRSNCIVIPVDIEPDTIDLRFSAGVDCIVEWLPAITEYSRVHGLCMALFAHEARRVYVLNRENIDGSFFAKSVGRGVELPGLTTPEPLPEDFRTLYVLAGDRAEGIAFATAQGYDNLEIQHVEDVSDLIGRSHGNTLHVLPGARRRPNYADLIRRAGFRFEIKHTGALQS